MKYKKTDFFLFKDLINNINRIKMNKPKQIVHFGNKKYLKLLIMI